MSDQPYMQAEQLTRHYTVKKAGFGKEAVVVKALDGVSFTLYKRKTLAIVGESGCGKSTLARQLTLIENPTSGELWVKGQDVAQASEKIRRNARLDVQMIFQNPYSSLNPRKTIGAILEEPLRINSPLSKAQRQEQVRNMIDTVGLRPEHYHRYPHMFSGGQRQRVAIARALMLKPAVIVADEPVSALDVSIQAQVLNLMLDLQEEMQVAYVFISHDLSVVQHIADEVMVMYLGHPVEHGPQEEVFERPHHPYTQALLSAMPRLNPEQRSIRTKLTGELPSPLNPPSGCPFHTRCPMATTQCSAEIPQWRWVEGRQVACHYAEQAAAQVAVPVG